VALVDAVKENGEKIILFNHRLNNTTNWQWFLTMCDRLYEKRKDFVVWFTDDSDKAKVKMLLAKRYTVIQAMKEDEYGYLLKNSHFAVCCHKGYSTWNMAVLDSLQAGCFTLVPQGEPAYTAMFVHFCTKMYHNNDDTLVEKMDGLLNEKAEDLKELTIKIKDTFPSYFSLNGLIRIGDDIERAINNRLDLLHVPAKYDEVKQLIADNPGITKGEIVNRLWSFHVNSNFQKIRWRLLKDGMADNTQKPEATYNTP
jgi:hypothetical protein